MGLGLGGPTATNPVAGFLDGLERIAIYDDHEVLPGHGYRFTGLAERCAEATNHRNQRTAEVAAVLATKPDSTVWEIASQLTWTAGWENFRGFYVRSALAQTAMHRDYIEQFGVPVVES